MQSTRNSNSLNFNEVRFEQAKKKATRTKSELQIEPLTGSYGLAQRTEDQQIKMLETLKKDFNSQIKNFMTKQSKQQKMNTKLEEKVVQAERTIELRHQSEANQAELICLDNLEQQMEEMKGEIDHYDEENKITEDEIHRLTQQLSEQTGFTLDDSIDHEPPQFSSVDTTGQQATNSSTTNKETNLLEELVKAKSRAMMSIQNKKETDKAVRQEFAFNADDDFY